MCAGRAATVVIARWEGDRLTLWDATQYVSGVKETVAKTFGLSDAAEAHRYLEQDHPHGKVVLTVAP